jgi:hypothetical protein
MIGFVRVALAVLLALSAAADLENLRTLAIKRTGNALVARAPVEGKNCFTVLNGRVARHFADSSNSTRSREVCLPQIMVGGVKKCGTSALFQLLASHQSTLPTVSKELCPRKREMLTYFRRLPRLERAINKTVVSGCLFEEDVIRAYTELEVFDLKVILVVRDFAERAWAAYNFWCQPALDQPCAREYGWTSDQHYRSPEMFHQLVLAQQVQPGIKLWMPGLLTGAPTYYKEVVTKWTNTFGDANVLVISQHDLEAAVDSVWPKIAEFAGLDVNHVALRRWSSLRYNTQEKKGEKTFTRATQYVPSVYPISGNRPMMNETRAILNEAWREDCLWLKEKHGLEFSACLSSDGLPSTKRGASNELDDDDDD